MYMAHERRRYILRLLQQRKYLRSSALAQELGVTDETIRTDLVALQKLGLLQREHGGARFIPPLRSNPHCHTQRLDSQLAAQTIPHIPPHARLYLDSGTCAAALIAHLGEHPCTIVTNSLDLMRAAAPPAIPQHIICTGGSLIKKEKMLDSEEARAQLQIDIAILSPHAIQPGNIAYNSSLRAQWAKAAIQAAAHTIIVVPAHALNAHAEHIVPCIPNLLITEDNLPPSFSAYTVETVPYISQDSFAPPDAFDY